MSHVLSCKDLKFLNCLYKIFWLCLKNFCDQLTQTATSAYLAYHWMSCLLSECLHVTDAPIGCSWSVGGIFPFIRRQMGDSLQLVGGYLTRLWVVSLSRLHSKEYYSFQLNFWSSRYVCCSLSCKRGGRKWMHNNLEIFESRNEWFTLTEIDGFLARQIRVLSLITLLFAVLYPIWRSLNCLLRTRRNKTIQVTVQRLFTLFRRFPSIDLKNCKIILLIHYYDI